MLSTGFTHAQQLEYLATRSSSHTIKVTVQILTNEHAVVSSVSHILMDGQVDGSAPTLSGDDIEVSRTCSLVFLDPGETFPLASTSPADGALYLDRMVRVVYSVLCPSGWRDVPVFTGPVVDVDRDGDFVKVQARGKEQFGLADAYTPGTFSGRKVDTMRSLLLRAGETDTYLALPSSTERLASPVTVARDSKLWAKAFRVAASMNRRLYYDARGVCRCPLLPSKPVATLRTGDGGTILSKPNPGFSTDDTKNIARVTGGKPKGSKKAVVASASAPSSSPFNAYKIGRFGKPRWLAIFEDNPDIRSTSKALARAKQLLNAHLLQQVELSFDCLPIPELEPWDIITVETDHYSMNVRVNSFSLPLTADGAMTIGYRKNLAKPRRRIRS